MPTAILDLEATRLPSRVSLPAGRLEALVLFRWHGRPVAIAPFRTRDGIIPGEDLRQAILDQAGWTIEQLRVREWLGLDPDPDAGPAPTIAVAVCTRDRPQDLARCLEAIGRMPDDGQEVLVVDSCSRGPETRELVGRHPGIRYLRAPRPGLDIARNLALASARADVVAFCDDDAAPDPGWLRALARGFADPRTLCVTGLTLPIELETPAQEWFERTGGFARGCHERVFDGVTMNPFLAARVGAGVNMALRRSAVDLVGGFDEALDAGMPTQSGGDHDMFIRILAAGYRIVYRPTALSWHRHRREWPELRRAVRGYGTGVYAMLTRHLLQGEVGAPLLALGWLRWQLAGLWKAAVRRPGSPPPGILLEELRGCLAGPAAYFAARRQLTRPAGDGPDASGAGT
jgi:GT2 family glycosyltransferase